MSFSSKGFAQPEDNYGATDAPVLLEHTMNFLFMNLDVYLPPIPLDLLEILTRGLVERVCDGRLDEARAAELALGRATFLLTHDVYLPLTPAIAAAVYEAIHEQEKCVYYGE